MLHRKCKFPIVLKLNQVILCIEENSFLFGIILDVLVLDTFEQHADLSLIPYTLRLNITLRTKVVHILEHIQAILLCVFLHS
jgi:hypothetical protein